MKIAAHEYGAAVENPLTLWDIHWLKELDDEGFIYDLVESLFGCFTAETLRTRRGQCEKENTLRAGAPASVISNEVRDLS
jgi:hypothetical protein